MIDIRSMSQPELRRFRQSAKVVMDSIEEVHGQIRAEQRRAKFAGATRTEGLQRSMKEAERVSRLARTLGVPSSPSFAVARLASASEVEASERVRKSLLETGRKLASMVSLANEVRFATFDHDAYHKKIEEISKESDRLVNDSRRVLAKAENSLKEIRNLGKETSRVTERVKSSLVDVKFAYEAGILDEDSAVVADFEQDIEDLQDLNRILSSVEDLVKEVKA